MNLEVCRWINSTSSIHLSTHLPIHSFFHSFIQFLVSGSYYYCSYITLINLVILHKTKVKTSDKITYARKKYCKYFKLLSFTFSLKNLIFIFLCYFGIFSCRTFLVHDVVEHLCENDVRSFFTGGCCFVSCWFWLYA